MATFTNAELIAQVYIGFYDRAPDPVGLQYWIGRLDAGVSIQDIGDSFAASPEAKEVYPYFSYPELLSPDDFLAQVYQNVFGRAIDADGLAYYKARIDSGESAGSVVASILGNAATNEGSPDQAYLQNKVDAGLYWANESATTPNINIYDENGRLTDAANNSAHGVIDGVNADPASVEEAKGEADAFFGAASFNLTTGIDNVIGTTGDDVFHGTSTAAGLGILDSTLNSGDSIDGGGGNDTLKIVSTLGILPAPVVPNLTSVENIDAQVAGIGGQFILDLANSTGVESVGVSNTTNAGAGYLHVANIVDGAINNTHDGQLVIQYDPSVVLGADDTQNVSITNSAAMFGAGDVNGQGIENLVVTTTGADPVYEENELYYSGFGLETATISGDGPLYISFNDSSALETVDASASTGGVYVDDLDNGIDVTVTGGSGDDVFWFYNDLTKTDVVDGGDGFDTVGVDNADYTVAADAAGLNALTSIEQIRFYNNGADVAVNGATLTNADVTSLFFDGEGNVNNVDVTNAHDDWSYTFREEANNATIVLTDQATTFNITLSGDEGLQHVTGDGDHGQIQGTLDLQLSGVVAPTAVATVNLDSSGDLANGDYNQIADLEVKVGSTVNVTGNADLHIDAINTVAAPGQHITVDASAFTGDLTVMGSAQADGAAAGDGLATGDIIKLGSGSDTVVVDADSSGFTDFDTSDLATDSLINFTAGNSGDVLDRAGADYTYTAINSATAAAIDALGSGATLQDAADLAAGDGANEWTAFAFQGHTYALFDSDGNATFDTGADTLVELVGVHVGDLTAANFA
jgi:hypothetical protein